MPRALFPAFLLPSAPFRRRRQSSSDSASSEPSPGTSPTAVSFAAAPVGVTPTPYLGHHKSYLRCARCAVDLCLTSAIVSRGFTGRWGRAYLVAAPADSDPSVHAATGMHPGGGNGSELPALPNTHVHRPVPRQLVTGAHTVSDVSCAFCGSVLGWKYVAADEESQRYKVGKFILETKRVSVVADWEQPDPAEGIAANADVDPAERIPPPDSLDGLAASAVSTLDEEDIVFDSQDEEECEDLFAGIWSPALAAKRRRSKRFDRERGL